jgi:hypothetical protein
MINTVFAKILQDAKILSIRSGCFIKRIYVTVSNII